MGASLPELTLEKVGSEHLSRTSPPPLPCLEPLPLKQAPATLGDQRCQLLMETNTCIFP